MPPPDNPWQILLVKANAQTRREMLEGFESKAASRRRLRLLSIRSSLDLKVAQMVAMEISEKSNIAIVK